ncbi:hypothetical protein [Candidatus Wolbachia massiliensis]|uniref:Uncharacterized protein n=1 Tax=Candidatus Wolbachia massiliensis TaxID=1845000 RepID=A0A7M3U393_9RICK|nr:hypothetical protein [Candidatus Wolbachia massiliensis]QOD38878.1 hypothetical protein ID128_06110 [Candidatus Wolbachia massiliensis]
MKIKLFFVFTILLLDINAYCNCEGIVGSIEICKKYTCQQYIGNEDFIEHKILGLNDGNLCVYVEKQDDDEMVCHHSKYGMAIEKKYLESIFKVGNQEISDFIDIANVRAKECFFMSNQKTSYTDRDNIIKEAVESDFDVLSQYNDMKSIFFDEELVNKMVSEMEKFYLRSSRTAKEEALNNFNCEVVRLDSILYLSPDTWKIWVNGRLFTNTKDLKVHSVTENYVTFIWTIDQKAVKKRANDYQNIYFGHGNIMFTLSPKQKFDLDSLSIK